MLFMLYEFPVVILNLFYIFSPLFWFKVFNSFNCSVIYHSFLYFLFSLKLNTDLTTNSLFHTKFILHSLYFSLVISDVEGVDGRL